MNKRDKIRKEMSGESKRTGFEKFLSAIGFNSSWDVDLFRKNVPFILFIALLAWFHIGNNHKAVSYIRSIHSMEKEIKELRWEYMTKKSELMHESKQSEVAEKVKDLGLKELTDPPYIIEVEN